MSSILTETTGNSVLGKQNRKPYIYSVIIMGFFTFLFLGAVYLYDNMISLMLSEKETVLAQNYALGVSTLGFLLYPVLRRFAKKQWRVGLTLFTAIASVLCLFIICRHVSYEITLISGIFLFLFLGVLGSTVFYTSACILQTDRYLARTVGASYMLGILLQFANNNIVSMETVEAVVLSIFLLVLVFLLIKAEQGRIDDSKNGNPQNKKRITTGFLLILLIVLMTCIFSTLDNAVTLEHAAGKMDIGQWPRILLALSGLAAGFIFDIGNRKFMNLIMCCVMMLSTISIALLNLGGPFLAGLASFYMSAGFFAVFFTAGFMEISCYMKVPELWAGMGRAVNNITAALVAKASLDLLSSGSSMASIVITLVLFVAVIIVAAAYTSRMKTITEEALAREAYDRNRIERIKKISEVFSFTPREAEVFDCLVNTDDSLQAVAENLYISRRTLERYISAIYKKTGTRSRVGLIRISNDR